jgi:hypothetical protein
MFSPNPNSSSKEQRTTKSQKPQRSIIHHPLPRICCHSRPPCVIRPPSCLSPLFFLCITALVLGPPASVPDNQRPVFKEIKFSASWTKLSSRAAVCLDLLCFVKEKKHHSSPSPSNLLSFETSLCHSTPFVFPSSIFSLHHCTCRGTPGISCS